MPTRRHYKGNAVPTNLNGAITSGANSIVMDASTGWPTGATGPFFAVIDRGVAGKEEVVLATSLTGSTLNSVTRGQADTVAVAHDDNAVIEHVGTKVDLDEANAHAADAEADPHATKLLNNTRHDATARHTPGSVVPVSSTATNLSGSASTGGAAANLSRGDHGHVFPAWSTYTPSATGFAVGNGTVTGRYLVCGKLLVGLLIQFTAGGTSSFSGSMTLSLPAGVTVSSFCFGRAVLTQGGVTVLGTASFLGTAMLQILVPDPSPVATGMSTLSNTAPGTWASGDSLTIDLASVEID